MLTSWPLPRLLILCLLPAFLLLAGDIRLEHNDILPNHPWAWIPILVSFLLFLLAALAVLLWTRRSRILLLIAFALTFFVGPLGYYFHNEHHLVQPLSDAARVWFVPQQDFEQHRPRFASLAFSGLALLGLLATLPTFQPKPTQPRP